MFTPKKSKYAAPADDGGDIGGGTTYVCSLNLTVTLFSPFSLLSSLLPYFPSLLPYFPFSLTLLLSFSFSSRFIWGSLSPMKPPLKRSMSRKEKKEHKKSQVFSHSRIITWLECILWSKIASACHNMCLVWWQLVYYRIINVVEMRV